MARLDLPERTVVDESYEILSLLGRGGMGTVYKAKDLHFDRVVALKLMDQPLVDPTQNARFLREAQSMSLLSHKNVIAVYRFGLYRQKLPFIVMEFLQGQTLRQRVQEKEHLNWRDAVPIMKQLACGLQAIHKNGIVHRDLNPNNVFICADGTVKLLDFGLCRLAGIGAQQKLTQADFVVGTTAYMSPEQCTAKETTPASDIYAYGCTMYEILTGHTPFSAGESVALMHAQCWAEVKPFSPDLCIPKLLEELVLSCLEKNPDLRPPTEQLQDTLDQLMNDPAKASPPEKPSLRGATKQRDREKHNRPFTPALKIVLLLSVAVIAIFMFAYTTPSGSAFLFRQSTQFLPPAARAAALLLEADRRLRRDDQSSALWLADDAERVMKPLSSEDRLGVIESVLRTEAAQPNSKGAGEDLEKLLSLASFDADGDVRIAVLQDLCRTQFLRSQFKEAARTWNAVTDSLYKMSDTAHVHLLQIRQAQLAITLGARGPQVAGSSFGVGSVNTPESPIDFVSDLKGPQRDPLFARCCFELGRVLQQKGKVPEASAMYRRGLAATKPDAAIDSVRLGLMDSINECLVDNGSPSGMTALDRELQSLQKMPDSLDLQLRTADSIAQHEERQSEFPHDKQLLENCLTKVPSSFSNQALLNECRSTLVFIELMQFASAYVDGRHDVIASAEQSSERSSRFNHSPSLAMAEQSSGKHSQFNHSKSLALVERVAVLLLQGRPVDAQDLCLSDDSTESPFKDCSLLEWEAMTLHHLGDIRMREGLDSEQLFKAALESRQQVLHAGQPLVAVTMQRYACSLIRNGKISQARQLLEQALAEQLKESPPVYPGEVALTEQTIGDLLARASDTRNTERACSLYENALKAAPPQASAVWRSSVEKRLADCREKLRAIQEMRSTKNG